VKILDIGLARRQGEEGIILTGQQGEGELTTEGVLLGTPDYMAPEQARDARAVDIRSDIYSLGCVLYHSLAGQPPFPDTNLINQMIRHATEAPKSLRDFNPAVPDGLQQIVNWMLAKDPKGRYPTPERASQALQVFLTAGSTDAPTAPPPDQKLKTFLDWVDVENSKDDLDIPTAALAKPTPTSAAVPVAKPAKTESSSTHPKAPAKPPEPKPRQEKKPKRPPAAVPVATGVSPPAGGTPATADPGFDVELVPPPSPILASPPRQRSPGGKFELMPRDFIMFGAGVAGTLLAIGAAFLLVQMLGGKAASSTEPTPSAPATTAPQ
jgi:serine/threonine protein kinase